MRWGPSQAPNDEFDGELRPMQQNAEPSAVDPAAMDAPPVPVGTAGAESVPGPGPADPAPDFAALLKKVEDEAAGLRDAWLRARADIDNLRKQGAADVARAHKYALERFAIELLPVKDALESTLAAQNASSDALRAGVELTLKQLSTAFEKAQILEIDAAGRKFDPHRHQAMAMVDSPEPANTVVQVFQKGYLLSDRILRPAMVAVAKPRDGGA
jgi:molecular chaperone GrpE